MYMQDTSAQAMDMQNLMFGKVFSPPPVTFHGGPKPFSPVTALMSIQAHQNYPLRGEHIVHLKSLNLPVPKGDIEHWRDHQMYGFNLSSWTDTNKIIFPIDYLAGIKRDFGINIKSNYSKKGRDFIMKIMRRSTAAERDRLMEYIEQDLPSLTSMDIYIKRKKFEIYEGIMSIADLRNTIDAEVKTKRMVIIKLSFEKLQPL